MAFVASVLWMIPATITLLVFAGLFALWDAVKNAKVMPPEYGEDED